MSVISLANSKKIGDYKKPYIVAELNTSHFGNIDTARDMIRQAKSSGCDCVKFQSWSSDTLYCEDYYRNNLVAKRMVEKFSLDKEALKELSCFANEIMIDFSSTPYSINEAEYLVDHCKVPFIKIASMELDNLPYLSQLGRLGVPLVLSTGMGSFSEIIRAVDTIEQTGNKQIIILHCTSVYPSLPNITRLLNIVSLRAEFPEYPIGYSDHSVGLEIPIAAVALGACLIEKHFTLDKTKIGMDNQMATEPIEMKSLVSACHSVNMALGGSARLLSSEEQLQITKMRRSMVSKRALPSGTELTKADIEFKRPGTGISPAEHSQYLGRILKADVQSGTVIRHCDFIDFNKDEQIPGNNS